MACGTVRRWGCSTVVAIGDKGDETSATATGIWWQTTHVRAWEDLGEETPDGWGSLGSDGSEGKLEQVNFASRVGPVDGFGPRREKNYFYPKHFSFNTELNLIPGNLLRDLIKLLKFYWV
jgi:hypothetical protein